MKQNSWRFKIEERTLRAMIGLYCERVHRPADRLCAECAALEEYALGRLVRCPFGSRKPNCAACTIHCYQPAMRSRAQAAMRLAGPLMLRRHPVLALMHIVRRLRSAPQPARSKAKI